LSVLDRKSENKACKTLKTKEFTGVNACPEQSRRDCFQNERNPVIELY